MDWKLIESIEGLEGLNGLDVGSPHYKEYFRIIQTLDHSHDIKKIKEAEYSLGFFRFKGWCCNNTQSFSDASA